MALNPLPGASGSRTLPDTDLRVESGASVLVQLTNPTTARLLVADNFNPNHRVENVPGEFRIMRRQDFDVAIADRAPFSEFVIEANRPRFARDGTMIPPIEYSRSALAHGTADRAARSFSDHALWHADPASGMLELRIPWGLLLVTDPSSRQVYAGADRVGVPRARTTAGVSVAVITLEPGAGGPARVVAALPAATGQRLAAPAVYAWETWDDVRYRPYFKASYFALTKVFEILGRGPRP
jgi:hypothetical protein